MVSPEQDVEAARGSRARQRSLQKHPPNRLVRARGKARSALKGEFFVTAELGFLRL
jgi:hypothetical protein